MIVCASQHLSNAQVHYSHYKALIYKSRLDCKNNLPHADRSYTVVVYYGQNMEVPFYGKTQLSETYCYKPMSVYKLGVVNSAHLHDRADDPKDHMCCHVYDECVTGKGCNTISSVTIKTLQGLDLLKNDQSSSELNIIVDNCSGQNKI